MPSYTDTWDETNPPGGQGVNLGDDRIREFKRSFRERLATDHQFKQDETGDSNIGYHKKTTLLAQASDQASVTDALILYSKLSSSVASLFAKDQGGNQMQWSQGYEFIGGYLKQVKLHWGTLAQIPAGWALCDGTNGLPDLREKFIRCVAAATNPASLVADATMVAAHTHAKGTLAVTIPDHGHDFEFKGDTVTGDYFWRDGANVNATPTGTATESVRPESLTASVAGATASSGSASFYALAMIGMIQ